MTHWEAIDDPIRGHRRTGASTSVVLLHGFTQTGLSWTRVTDALGPDLDLVAPDAPGHGRSTTERLDLPGYATRLAFALPRSVYVGYSMGGRTALHVALQHPDRVNGLVLIGATPGIEDTEERLARRTADDALARHVVDTPLDDFLVEWLSQNLFSTLPREAWNLEDRRRNDPEGLAASLRRAGTGTQESLWPRLSEIACPVVVVTGELDTKFTAIARRMISSFDVPAEHVVVPGCGHAVHLERPTTVAAIVDSFVRRVESRH